MRAKTIGLLSLLTLALAGCGPTETTTPEATPGTTTAKNDKKDIRITMIAKSSSNPVFMTAKVGAEDAAKKIGDEQGIKITIDWRTPANEDGQVQAQTVADAANSGVSAILISCSDAAKVTGAINDAVDKGIPVMTFDSDAPDSKRFAFYGVNDEETGAQLVQELAKITDKGNVAILAGNQNAPNLQRRVKGAKDELAKHPGFKFIQVVNHVETGPDAAAAVVAAMNANPAIDTWVMIGGWPLFVPSLADDLGPKKTKVVAVDGLPAQLIYVDKGIAPVLLAQPTYKWGYESVRLIVDKLQGKPVETINKMELVKVTKESLGTWARQLKDWKMEGIDQKYLDMK